MLLSSLFTYYTAKNRLHAINGLKGQHTLLAYNPHKSRMVGLSLVAYLPLIFTVLSNCTYDDVRLVDEEASHEEK